ncbi:hypothetical protein L1887_14937 [Cichorium endivia]|nr:hypothetical protein L1887_14937 [Cichorium endivia]
MSLMIDSTLLIFPCAESKIKWVALRGLVSFLSLLVHMFLANTVAISRLLNATLVILEIQESTSSNGISFPVHPGYLK